MLSCLVSTQFPFWQQGQSQLTARSERMEEKKGLCHYVLQLPSVQAFFSCFIHLVIICPHMLGVSILWAGPYLDFIYHHWWPVCRLAGWEAGLTSLWHEHHTYCSPACLGMMLYLLLCCLEAWWWLVELFSAACCTEALLMMASCCQGRFILPHIEPAGN